MDASCGAPAAVRRGRPRLGSANDGVPLPAAAEGGAGQQGRSDAETQKGDPQ
jgi:hypothetical protein